MQFYILMVDFGKSYPGKSGPSGFEAVCNPELTRRNIVDQVRDLIARGKHSVAFVKFADGNYIEDVTADIDEEARAEEVEIEVTDRQSIRFDHKRDLRKNFEAAE